MSADPSGLDTFIEQLMTCKPLKESEVRLLCEKVKFINYRLKKYSKRRVMSKLLEPL
jgi:hypothetical protein